MLLEIAQARQAMREIGAYFDAIRKAWEDEHLAQLVVMEKVRLLLMEQDLRQSALAVLKPAPRDDDPDEPEPALVDQIPSNGIDYFDRLTISTSKPSGQP
ncbi:hypothetical protein [Caballeronia sp. S22]|uniref:hypothetical protein n=1 Tax=Caballeronia sp. S22 TaxID=3137182 RepID=UPI00353068AD